MKIVYDERKRQTNLAKHGLDFADLDLGFFDRAYFEQARDGRLKAVGWFRMQLVVVAIVRPLGTEGLSVVSMRPANFKEKRKL